jgi:coenzyme F420-0:L-glutamate ligase/coenzyme F420-1:gamma-L-glutamate ligase
VLLLPRDPDGTAARVRGSLRTRTGVNVAVIITDTAGRAWRDGQTDIAIGAAGLRVLEDFAGQYDGYGNPLIVTAPAVADELAGAAELAQGKLRSRPFAVISGREDLVLFPDDDGPGAATLIRAEGADLFGWGAREAVVRALQGHAEDRAPFGVPTEPEELIEAIRAALGLRARVSQGTVEVDQPLDPVSSARLHTLAFAFGWQVEADSILRPVSP